ncbi:MAG: ABC transporter substrate-binding protein [Pseudomonadota bacterium]
MTRRKGFITRQAKRLTDGEINRRRFVMSALSAGVTLPTAMSLASRAEANGPKFGGTLRLAIGDGGFDKKGVPQDDSDAQRLFAFARGNTLTEVAADGSIKAELAERFEPSQNGLVWTFHLREDVRFQDGAPLTADDVVETLLQQRAALPLVKGMTADGTHVVRVALLTPDAGLPRYLAHPRFIIRSADTKSTTGPYRMDAHSQNCVRLVRQPDYWKHGHAHFEAVEMHAMPDVSMRLQAIMAGDVDYADGIDPRALALLHHTADVDLFEVFTGRGMALSLGPFGNGALLNEVLPHLPRTELVNQILLGHGKPGIAPEGRASSALPSDLTLFVKQSGVPRADETARLIEAHLADRGCSVRRAETSEAADLILGWEKGALPARQADWVFWASDLSAHSKSLKHGSHVGSNLANDGARLIERWWFA